MQISKVIGPKFKTREEKPNRRNKNEVARHREEGTNCLR